MRAMDVACVSCDDAVLTARTPLGIGAATCLLAGVVACLLLPALPAWPWLAASFALGLRCWLQGARFWLIGPALVGFGMAGLHAAVALHQQLPPALEGDTQVLIGKVVELPRVEARRTRFRFEVEQAQASALRGRHVQLSWYDDYDATQPGRRLQLHAGERWRLHAKLRAPRGLRNPGGFDQERHALAQRTAGTGYLREVDRATRLAAGTGIDAWRERTAARIAAAVPWPTARFVRALALGDTGGLDDGDWNVLRATGLTHLIAISGFHVGLAAGFFALLAQAVWWLWPGLARSFPRVQAAGIAAACGGLIYTAIAGFALPTVRTMLMIMVIVAARLWRRPQSSGQALALATIAMLLVDPLAPLAPGFWLSFAGVAWLLWCLPSVRAQMVRGLLSAQAVATLGLLPLTAVLFGQASLSGPLANLLAVPWWSLVVVPLALLGTALDWIYADAGAWLWKLSALAFDLLWPLFQTLAASPFTLWWLPEARWYALPLAMIAAFWLLLPRGTPGKPLALLLWLPLLWPDRGLPGPGEAELHLLDVGQGLSILVRTRTHSLLYDLGPKIEDGFDAGERVVVPALYALGVRRLDKVIVSHADNDHVGGLDAVLAAQPVSEALGAPGDPLAGTRDCLAGQTWHWDRVEFRFLHPERYFPYLKNESSCVLRIQDRYGAILLTGDISAVVERMLLRAGPTGVRAEVVTISHHGSKDASDPSFVAAARARVALASAGFGNRFGHPSESVIERWRSAGTQVYVTADTGALRLRLGAHGPVIEARRRTQPRLWDAVRRRARTQTDDARTEDARAED